MKNTNELEKKLTIKINILAFICSIAFVVLLIILISCGATINEQREKINSLEWSNRQICEYLPTIIKSENKINLLLDTLKYEYRDNEAISYAPQLIKKNLIKPSGYVRHLYFGD